jgi:tetratricopeptide (TPR) repeat protein
MESENARLFKAEKEPFPRQKSLCLPCLRKKEESVHWYFWWTLLTFGVLGLTLTLAYPRLAVGCWFLNAGFALLAGLADTILHEAGHALSGTAVGMRIFSIDIGSGVTVCELKRWGFRWRFHAILFGGMVIGLPRTLRAYRIRQAIFILGGPLANAVLAVFAWRFTFLDDLLDTTRFSGFMPMRMLLLANSVSLLLSLWPREFTSRAGKLANDGLLLLRLWRKKAERIKDYQAFYFIYEAAECLKEQQFDEMEQWTQRGLAVCPDNVWLKLTRATGLIHQNKFEQARETLKNLLEKPPKEPLTLSTLFNNIAYVDALLDRAELLKEADLFSRNALEASPSNTYFKGTRGLALVQLGRYDEGVALISEALQKHTEKPAKAICACCLVIAATKQGRMRESEEYYALARSFDSSCYLLD